MRYSLLLFFLSFNSAWAEVKSNPAVEASVTKEPLSSAYMGQLMLSLLFILGLILGLAWLVKKFNVIPQQGQRIIKILSTISVGNRDRISLIQVGEEQILISLSPGRITKLHDMTVPVEIEHNTQVATPAFAKTLSGLMNKNKAQNGEEHA